MSYLFVAESNELKFIETSGLNASNVEEAFETILKGNPYVCCPGLTEYAGEYWYQFKFQS